MRGNSLGMCAEGNVFEAGIGALLPTYATQSFFLEAPIGCPTIDHGIVKYHCRARREAKEGSLERHVCPVGNDADWNIELPTLNAMANEWEDWR